MRERGIEVVSSGGLSGAKPAAVARPVTSNAATDVGEFAAGAGKHDTRLSPGSGRMVGMEGCASGAHADPPARGCCTRIPRL